MKPHVALIIETSSVYGRELLAGIMRFVRTREDWSIFLQQRDIFMAPPQWLDQWHGDGIISRATTPQMLAVAAKNDIPLIELTDRHDDDSVNLVRSDDHAIGRLAASHLSERGFRHFAFAGYTDEQWSIRRLEGFRQGLAELDKSCVEFNSPWMKANRSWEEDQRAIGTWLKTLARPCGILACNDLRGQQVLDACSNISIRVPEEIAVVGVDNDELLCQFCTPPLSSIIPNAEAIGFAAAERLSLWMQARVAGAAIPKQVGEQCCFPPTGVAVRLSSDVVAIDHPEVAAALAFIREHACRGISVSDVLENVPISRSTLERQLRKHLSRTPQQEIRNVQLRRVRELLTTTDLSTEQIAHRAGFDHAEYMHYLFKRETQMTPGEYRKQVQGGAFTA